MHVSQSGGDSLRFHLCIQRNSPRHILLYCMQIIVIIIMSNIKTNDVVTLIGRTYRGRAVTQIRIIQK
jgi:hypothetical protein